MAAATELSTVTGSSAPTKATKQAAGSKALAGTRALLTCRPLAHLLASGPLPLSRLRHDNCLQAHYGKYEPTILELKRKYEAAMKEKMLAVLERDKMAAKVGQG